VQNEQKIFTVKELNTELKKITSTFFSNIYLECEISSIRFHGSGNIYLSLKDEESVIDAVIFTNNNNPAYRELKEGTKVLAVGGVSLNVKSGRYSFNIRELKTKGKGELLEKFLKLKEKLEKEGLFDDSFKKPIPFLPKKIGIVTSSTGAAVKDILTVTQRRFPSVDIIIFPALVQGGDEAALSIVEAVRAAEAYGDIDVLIVGRGGGSYEDLAVFNDERIAYALFQCPIPVVSAIGHERDFTIADFVADIRAATPSQAAELTVPDRNQLLNTIQYYSSRLEKKLDAKIQYADLAMERYSKEALLALLYDRINEGSEILDYYKDKIDQRISLCFQKVENRMEVLYAGLEKLNPLYILKKNYAAVYQENGEILKSVRDAEIGKNLIIELKDGKILTRTEKILNETKT